MLVADGMDDLRRNLFYELESMGIVGGQFGNPRIVEAAAIESEKLFQGYSKAKPSKEDAHTAALAFLRGQDLDVWQRDLLASVLAEPIDEHAGARVLGNSRLSTLLGEYELEAEQGKLWRLTWYALLSSYFSFDANDALDAERNGWEQLRAMLERTWQLLDHGGGASLVPDWVKAMRQETGLLSLRPTEKYARDYLEGSTEAVQRLASDLGISPSSWFWHALVLGAVKSATASSDEEFRSVIPRLIQLVEERPVYRDEAIEKILFRYHGCEGAPQDERLSDYVVRKDVWKNPKLKSAGIATAWNRVPDAIWQMVLGWVNERNLKDFFDILAARNQADEGRLAFWSRYLRQITWTRLVFGSNTLALKNRNSEIRNLIAREEGSYATLTANRDVDAFMMGIGDYIIVEFSKAPNAAYVYRTNDLKFNRHGKHYSGDTLDLKYGFNEYWKRNSNILRITHPPRWQQSAGSELGRLGIVPDTPGAKRVATPTTSSPSPQPPPPQASTVFAEAFTQSGTPIPRTVQAPVNRAPSIPGYLSPPGANFTMKELEFLVKRFPRAFINDRRGNDSGRLWVEDPMQQSQLAHELKLYGFRWANTRLAWYFPEQ